MKRFLSVLAALYCLSAPSARSQTFFHHTYGGFQAPDTAQGSCLSSMYGSTSHCITGRALDNSTDPPVRCIAVSRPNLNGQLISPDNFNLYYRLEDHLRRPCTAEGIAVAEFDNYGRPGFGITGVFSLPDGTSGFFLLTIDEQGVPIFFKPISYLNVLGERPTALVYGSNSGHLVITGVLPTVNPNDPSDIFVVAIDLFGNIAASNLLDIQPNWNCLALISDDRPFDIVVDPYNTATDKYYIVGSCTDQYNQMMGFRLGVDHQMLPFSIDLYQASSPDHEVQFYSVSPALQNGYIIGGRYGDRSRDDDALAVLIDASGGIAWSKIYDYAPHRGTNNAFRDIREKRDDFYATGTAEQGFFGKKDIHAVHVNDQGNGISAGDYTYGSSEDDFPVGVETAHGLFFMGGTNQRDAGELYMVHPDWRGPGTCMTHIAEPVYADAMLSSYQASLSNVPCIISVDFPPFFINTSRMYDKTICGSTKPQLRNALQTQAEAGPVLYPNPAAGRFTVQLHTAATADIIVCDLSGRLVYEKHATSATTEIDASTWNAGMYLVHISEEGKTKKVLRLVLSH